MDYFSSEYFYGDRAQVYSIDELPLLRTQTQHSTMLIMNEKLSFYYVKSQVLESKTPRRVNK